MKKQKIADQEKQQGSAFMSALLVLMVICLTGAAVLNAAALERKVVVSQNTVEILRQAADGGIQAARNIIMNYVSAGRAIPAIDDICLDNGVRVTISCDLGSLDNHTVVSITSRAYMEGANGQLIAAKAVRAEMLTDSLPVYTVKASKAKFAGRYLLTVSKKPIDELGHQDWDINETEPRLAGDPDYPSRYPVQGPTYFSFEEGYKINHPQFNVDLPRPGEYTWQVIYQYLGQDEEISHDLEYSMINIAPFYNPCGYLEIVNQKGQPELMGLEQGWDNALTVEEESDLFAEELSIPAWGEYMSEEFYQSQLINELISSGGTVLLPEKELLSQDFVKTVQVIENVTASGLAPKLLERYRLLSSQSAEWEYLREDSDKLGFSSGQRYVDINGLDKTYIYIDCPEGETVAMDFNAVLESFDYSLTDWMAYNNAKFFDLIKDEGRNVVIVSPADLVLTMDNIMFKYLHDDVVFYFISPGSINLVLGPVVSEYPDLPRDINAFMWAGDNIYIHSAVRGCDYSGLIYAGNRLHIDLAYPSGTLEEEPYFRIEKSNTIMHKFPNSWVYLGMGPIITYDYID